MREAKFGPHAAASAVEPAQRAAAPPGGDVVLVIDGWKNFTETLPDSTERVIALMRARNYGVRVVITHTSTLSGVRTAIRNETGAEAGDEAGQEHDTRCSATRAIRSAARPGRCPTAPGGG